MKIEDLPESLQKQAWDQIASVRRGGFENPIPVPLTIPVKETPRIKQRRTDGRSQLHKDFEAHLRNRAEAMGEGATVYSEAMTLELANGCTYRADLLVLLPHLNDALEVALYEVKGPKFWDDAVVKLKVAARAFPLFRFYLASRGGKGKTGFQIERILP